MHRHADLTRKEGDGESVGLFIPLPPYIADQFPGGVDGNGGVPHVTFLYIGGVNPEEYGDLVSTLRSVIPKCVRGPVRGRLGELDFFEHPSEERRVAHLAVQFSQDLALAKDKVKDALQAAGFYIKDSYPVWRPHTTLEYMPGLDRDDRYKGGMPSGEWEFDSIELWDLPELHTFPLGRSETLKSAKKDKSEKEDEEAERLVRKKPKKKPSRKDRRRDRVKVDDPDIPKGNSGDPDMSLNYKKVGSKDSQSPGYMGPHIVRNHDALSPRANAGKRRLPVGPYRTNSYRGERNMPRKTATIKKSAAERLTTDLDKIASFFEHYHEAIGIPKKYAHDFAKRCDIFSDHIEKFAGMHTPGDFDAGSIGEVKPGPHVHDGDESSYMSQHFTQIDGEELRHTQEDDAWGC